MITKYQILGKSGEQALTVLIIKSESLTVEGWLSDRALIKEIWYSIYQNMRIQDGIFNIFLDFPLG